MAPELPTTTFTATSETPPASILSTGRSHELDGVSIPRDKTTLQRKLPPWQILMIGVSGVIGVTIFSSDGEIMNTAGPAGLLTALAVVAVTTICVMECIAELIIMWPVSNAMIEYVRTFVDEDLAIVVGIAYWYTMSSIFATLIIAAAEYSTYFIDQSVYLIVFFYVVVPISLVVINAVGVQYYGWIEGLGGIVKLVLVACGIVFMVVDAAKVKNGNISQNYRYQKQETRNAAMATCISIPLLAYGFIGTEIISVTAFEAKRRESLRMPARWIAYIITSLYVACALMEAIVVSWNDPCLANPEGNYTTNCKDGGHGPGSFAVIVIAAREYGSNGVGWFFNGCIIYFCMSAANTSLYVASRTLFGLTRGINRMDDPPWYLRCLKFLGVTSPLAQVPHWALIVSALAFYWLPIVHSTGALSGTLLVPIMSTTGSIGGLIVWTSQCLAYLRYHHWFHGFKKRKQLPPQYNRWHPQPTRFPWHESRPFLASIQPVPAWLGLIGCLLMVIVLTSATWWNGDVSFRKVAEAYAGPIILSVIFIALKLFNRRGWVVLRPSPQQLFNVTSNFERNSGLPLHTSEDEMTEGQLIRPDA